MDGVRVALEPILDDAGCGPGGMNRVVCGESAHLEECGARKVLVDGVEWALAGRGTVGAGDGRGSCGGLKFFFMLEDEIFEIATVETGNNRWGVVGGGGQNVGALNKLIAGRDAVNVALSYRSL